MKKLLILAACAGFIFSAVAASAAPVGNIATPVMLKQGLLLKGEDRPFAIIAGPEYDRTYDRNLEDQEEDAELDFRGAKFGVVVHQKAFIYAVAGTAEASQKFNISGTKVKWETDSEFVWGLGASLCLVDTQVEELGGSTLRFGADLKYRRMNLGVEKVTVGDTEYRYSGDTSLSNAEFETSEWQLALAASLKIGRFLPYLGVKLSDIDGDAEATVSGSGEYHQDPESHQNLGLFLGTDVLLTDSISFNVEGRIGDETALTMGTMLRF